MKRPILLMLTAALLTGCPAPAAPDDSGGTTPTTPTVPAGYLPTVGAAPETGPGPSKVRISPTADDLALMAYTNEFRTKGTIRGTDPTNHTLALNGPAETRRCLADAKWTPGALQPLSFNGVAHATAVNHARYLQTHGYYVDGDPHSESSQRTGYTGNTVTNRYINTNAAYQAEAARSYAGENALFGWHDNDEIELQGYRPFHDNAAYAVFAWAQSYGHCMNMLHSKYTDMGGSYLNPTPNLTSSPAGIAAGFNSGKVIGIQVFIGR